jgi:hypothetical protein
VNSGVCEEGRAKVEDKVDASELLPGLDEDTSERPEAEAIIRGPEAVKVATCANFLLVLQIETNLIEFKKNLRIVRGERREARKCSSGIGITLLPDQPTRGLG